MKITKVKEYENKFLELLKRVDIGEYRIVVNSSDFDVFDRWISKAIFTNKDNYGILTAFIFNEQLRIQLSFNIDVIDELLIKDIIEFINESITLSGAKRIDIWCNNHNTNLVKSLREKLDILPFVYMSHELQFSRDLIDDSYDITPLEVCNIKEVNIDEVLDLLEKSFVNLGANGSFIREKEYYHEKFKGSSKARFEGFKLNGKLIGMFYHNDAEIEYISVLPEYQGNGYGAKILKKTLISIKEDSIRTPHLYCVDSNERGLKFYIREGWNVSARSARLQMIVKE